MGANNQVTAPCDAYVNLSKADDMTIRQWIYPDIQIKVSLISRSIILIVGMVGNGAFLIVIARIRSMHTMVNFYLVNLAVADILVLLQHTAVPFVNYAVLQVPSNGHLFGAAGCMATSFFNYLGYFTSITLVCLMTTERFLAVCHPLKHLSINTMKRASKLVLCAWVLGTIFSACAIPTNAVYTNTCIQWPNSQDFSSYPGHVGKCFHYKKWTSDVFEFIQGVPFFAALICNTVFFTKIVRHLRSRERSDRIPSSPHGLRLARVRHHVTRMLLVNGVVFFICHAPFQVLSLFSLIGALADSNLLSHDSAAQMITRTIFRILVFVNSAVNPIVYSATNPRYRKAFVRVFACSSRARARASLTTPAAVSGLPQDRSVNALGLDKIGRRPTCCNGHAVLNEILSNDESQHDQITWL